MPCRYRNLAQLLLCCLAALPALAQDRPARVLVLNSYTPTFPTTDALLDGIRSELADTPHELEVEFLYSKAVWSDEYGRQVLQVLLRRQAWRNPFDVIIATDDHALHLLRIDGGRELQSPVVAVGINHPEQFQGLDRRRYTGAIERIDMAGTIQLARTLQDQVSRVVLIVDGSHSADRHLDLAVNAVRGKIPVDVLSMADEDVAALRGPLQSLPADAAVIVLSAHIAGRTEVSFTETHQTICDLSAAPCYSPFRHTVLAGPIGGSIIDLRDHGRIAGRYAASILAGTSPADLPLVDGTPPRLTVVPEALQRWPELAARIPADAIHLPDPPPRSSTAPWIIATGLALVGLVAAGIRILGRTRTEPLPKPPNSSEQHLVSVGRVATSVVHDLNNLLSVVQGYSDLIARQKDVGEDVRADVARIGAAGERAARLTRRVLRWSRGEHSESEVLIVREHLQDLATVLQPMVPAIALRIDADPTFAATQMPPAALDQIVLNLVANARDAAATHIEIRIEPCDLHAPRDLRSGTLVPGRWIRIDVLDDGHGIAASVLARAADEFFTTRKGNSSGVGLATVDRLVREARGQWQLANRDAGGVAAEIWLPAATDPGAAQRTARLTSEADALRGTDLVGVIDDDVDVRMLARRNLEQFGYRVICWSRPREMLQECTAESLPAALVVDLHLPEMSGPQLLDELRERFGPIPAILVSGTPEALHGQPWPVLEKPFDAFELVRQVHRALHTPA